MATIDTKGIAELGHWSPFPGGYWVLCKPTDDRHRVYIEVTDKPKRRTTKHRRHPKRVDNSPQE